MFLRRRQRKLPKAIIKAYADDIAMVCPGLLENLERIEDEFELFGEVSGMKLHYGKIQVVPLWEVEENTQGTVGSDPLQMEGRENRGHSELLRFSDGPREEGALLGRPQ